jgi:hypothetical protein
MMLGRGPPSVGVLEQCDASDSSHLTVMLMEDEAEAEARVARARIVQEFVSGLLDSIVPLRVRVSEALQNSRCFHGYSYE